MTSSTSVTRSVGHGLLDPCLDLVEVKKNLIADPIILKWDRSFKQFEHPGMTEYKYGDEPATSMLEERDNIIIEGDPGFVDIENENFHLKKDSPALDLGFKPIPIEKIGLFVDEYRASLPTRRE